MEIFNRKTLNKAHPNLTKIAPVTMKGRKTGKFILSKGLDHLLGKPFYIQFLKDGDKLFIAATGDESSGIVILRNEINKSTVFSFSTLIRAGVLLPDVVYIAFTEPVYLNLASENEPADMIQCFQLVIHNQ